MKKEEDFGVRHFTTDALPSAERLPVWREEFGRTLVNVDITPVSDEPIQAAACMRVIPGVHTLSFSGSAMRFDRTKAMIAAGDDSIGLIINRNPVARLSQCDQGICLSEGDACPMLSDEPGTLTSRSHIGLLFPRKPLVERARSIADVAAFRIPKESQALRLLVAYLSSLPEKLTLEPPKLRRTFVGHVYDLATIAMCPNRAIDENSLGATAAARLELALSYIKKNFSKPNLTIEAVARDQNVSPRYVQKLIETTGTTFTECIQELRLQYAYELLTAPRHKLDRISDLALRAGFSDVAHFNRSFRRKFGETPSGIRAAIKPE